MPKPTPSSPRAPCEVTGRVASSGTAARPRAERIALSAYERSGAVSANVPSRSKRIALIIVEESELARQRRGQRGGGVVAWLYRLSSDIRLLKSAVLTRAAREGCN